MALIAEKKRAIIKEYQKHERDTGSAEVQIALLTARINHLMEHFKTHPKDFSSRRGLLKMVGKRSALLKYLARYHPEKYQDVVKRLGLRK